MTFTKCFAIFVISKIQQCHYTSASICSASGEKQTIYMPCIDGLFFYAK